MLAVCFGTHYLVIRHENSQESKDPRDAHDNGQLDVDTHPALLIFPQHARSLALGARDVARRDEEEDDVEEEEEEERSGEEEEERVFVG